MSTQAGDQSSLLDQTEWLAKFWYIQKSGEFDSVDKHLDVIPLTYPWQWFIQAQRKEESAKLSCTIKEVTSALSEAFSLELKQILEQAKLSDQNEIVFFRYTILVADSSPIQLLLITFYRCQILRTYWEQLNLKGMATFETSLILLNILKSLHTSKM